MYDAQNDINISSNVMVVNISNLLQSNNAYYKDKSHALEIKISYIIATRSRILYTQTCMSDHHLEKKHPLTHVL